MTSQHGMPATLLIHAFNAVVSALRRSRRQPGVRNLRLWYKLQRADVCVLSFPKSGRSWLRFLIGHPLAQLSGVDVTAIPKTDDLYRLDPRIPRIRVTHDDFPHRATPAEVQTDKRHYAGKRVVLLVRDPRDVMVSWYHHLRFRRREAERFEGELGDLLRAERGGLASLIAYYNAWAATRDVPAGYLLMANEDLRADTAGQLERLFGFMGLGWVSREAIEASVEFCSFENMKRMEAEQGKQFRFGSWGKRDVTNPDSFKVRRGKVGGYRDSLSAADAAWADALIAERLDEFYARYKRPPETP